MMDEAYIDLHFPRCAVCNREVREMTYSEDLPRDLAIIRVRCHGRRQQLDIPLSVIHEARLGEGRVAMGYAFTGDPPDEPDEGAWPPPVTGTHLIKGDAASMPELLIDDDRLRLDRLRLEQKGTEPPSFEALMIDNRGGALLPQVRPIPPGDPYAEREAALAASNLIKNLIKQETTMGREFTVRRDEMRQAFPFARGLRPPLNHLRRFLSLHNLCVRAAADGQIIFRRAQTGEPALTPGLFLSDDFDGDGGDAIERKD
jgi:hypothetical protein